MWPRIPNTLLGIWLMAAPAILGLPADHPAATNDRIIGPLVVTFAVVAMSEALFSLRRANYALGAWLLIAPWVLGYLGGPISAIINSLVVGVLIVVFARIPGKRSHYFAGGWSSLLPGRPLYEGSRPASTPRD